MSAVAEHVPADGGGVVDASTSGGAGVGDGDGVVPVPAPGVFGVPVWLPFVFAGFVGDVELFVPSSSSAFAFFS